MRHNARCPRIPRPRQPEVLAPRRGNSIVLVMGILVLLVIIATAFITRTHAGRVTSSVAVRTTLRDDNARVIAEMLAYEIGAALFPFPIDPLLPGFDVPVNSKTPRLSQQRLDLDGDGNLDYFPLRYATDPNFPYNFAPYHVVPFTNWPDTTPGSPPDLFWPDGPGNDGGGTGSPNLSAEGNQVGNPGFGDARWLADIEPLRWDTNGDGILDAFSHWRHMTNIARPNNGWRIVVDISNVENSLVTNLSIPMEQWLVVQPVADNIDGSALFNPSGDTVYKGYFNRRWEEWFLNYGAVYYDPQEVPPNFYNLSDLNANGTPLELGERPQDEFIGPSPAWPNGTPRWNVNRILVDTDGDGFTDSFWYLAPTMTERGIRQIVAVRIIDNSAMLNVNVATRFLRNDSDFGLGPGSKTAGHSPADLALVGQLLDIPPDVPIPPNWNVGILDNPANHESVSDPFFYGNTTIGYEVEMWAVADTDGGSRALNYLQQIGIIDQNFILNPNFSTGLNTALDRLTYWQLAGLRPLAPVGGLTPFGFTEELELRMSNGQNYPWIASRFERAVQAEMSNGTGVQFLHANLAREESSEYLDQLSNRELMFDSRRKLTMYSGARNDEMPPWLWWRWELPQDVLDEATANPTEPIIDRFLAQARRKLDLREEVTPFLFPGERDLTYRLAPTLLLALVDGDEEDGSSYFGPYDSGDLVTGLTHARWLSAGLAANILESRDADSGYGTGGAGLLQDAAVPLPQVGSWGQDLTQRFLGMEKQPFLVEALIGHVYELEAADDPHPFPDPVIFPSDHVLCSDPETAGAVIVVQIANPYDTPLNLSDFDLSVFGEPVALTGSIPPGAARTYYAMEEEFGDLDLADEWVPLLDALDAVRVSSDIWTTDPDDFDILDEELAIELIRKISSNANGNLGTARVVVDRIDIKAPDEDFAFGEAVESMRGLLANGSCVEPPFGEEWPGVVNLGADTHWIQWVQVTRAWDVDLDNSGGIDPDERNPRYVFSNRAVDDAEASGSAGLSVAPTTNPAKFDVKLKGFAGDDFDLNFSMQMLQKDADFEQVGELLNVWMFGHLLAFESGPPGQLDTAYIETLQTFSEFMINDKVAGEGVRANRLTVVPEVVGLGEGLVGQVVGVPDPDDPNYPIYLLNPLHAVPAVPAGARVLDAFVCESLGVNAGGSRFGNANGFTGKNTPGLINVNTAPPEVLRSAPHMTRLVHEDNLPADNPFVRVPEAIVQYRERFGDPMDNTDPLPAYGDRGDDTFIEDLRGERGIASIGELMLITEPASFAAPPNLEPNENWQIDFGGLDPFTTTPGQSTQISTDVNDLPGPDPRDIVAADAEELNLLFGGMSNMLTTRSDVFTVYFRVRSFIQNPTTRVWDATNPEFIVDDSRYVMLVDRSEVNHPNDKPKILYLEKLPK